MDLTHWVILVAVAMIFLAQREAHRELRERFEQMRDSPGR